LSFPIYFDEDASGRLATLLSSLGHDILTTHAAGRMRSSDEDQLRFAASTGRAVFTHNVDDYQRLAMEWANAGLSHAGILFSRRADPYVLRARFLKLFELYPEGITNICMYLPRPD
jgi:hypothetical protein